MPDEIDKAEELAYELLTRAIAYTSQRPPELAPIGECYNCGERVPNNMRFCDADCYQDWEKRRKHGKVGR